MMDGNNNSFSILAALQQGVQALGGIRTALGNIFPQTTGTTTSATGGAATLPANPVGFIVVTLPNGTSAKVPYYG
jgi:hypothetical protein